MQLLVIMKMAFMKLTKGATQQTQMYGGSIVRKCQNAACPLCQVIHCNCNFAIFILLITIKQGKHTKHQSTATGCWLDPNDHPGGDLSTHGYGFSVQAKHPNFFSIFMQVFFTLYISGSAVSYGNKSKIFSGDK